MSKANTLTLEQGAIASYNAYAEGLDSKDWAQVRRCFADEVYIDYGVIIDPEGDPAVPKRADDWVAQLKHNIGGFDITRHTISNHRFNTDGELPSCTAYLVADHVILPDPLMPIASAEDIATVIGEYTNQYQRINNEWKIVKSKLDIHWSTGNIALFAQAIARGEVKPVEVEF